MRRALVLGFVCLLLPLAASAQVSPAPAQAMPVWVTPPSFVSGSGIAIGPLTAPRYLSNTAAPAISSCGTGSIDSNSTDAGGKVTATGATACTVTFTTAYPSAAWCVITDDTTVGVGKITAQSASAFTVSSLTSGDTFQYHCNGK